MTKPRNRKLRQPDAEHKAIASPSKPLEIKAKADGPGEVSGYASVFGVVDLHGDIIKQGAFAKTIRERVPAGKIKLLDSHYPDGDHTLGTVVEAYEDETGLFFRAELSSTGRAQEIRTKMAEGHLQFASIGFDMIDAALEEVDGELIRVIREVKLYEISIVPFPANEMAGVRAKSAIVPVPFQDLPTAPDDAEWDELAARERVEKWAGGDAVKLRRAHLVYIPGKGYDGLIADVVDDELVAVPAALRKYAKMFEGIRAPEETSGIPELSEVTASIKKFIDGFNEIRINAMKYLGDQVVAGEELGEGSSPTGPLSSTLGEEVKQTDTQQAGPPQAPTSERSTDHLKSDSRRRRSLEARLESARHKLASHGVPDHASCRSADSESA